MFGIPLNIRFLSSSEIMNTIVQAFSQWLCSLYLSVYIRAGEVTQRISHNTSMVLRSNLWSSQFVTVSQFVTESVAICDGCRNLWRKVSQFVTASKYAI